MGGIDSMGKFYSMGGIKSVLVVWIIPPSTRATNSPYLVRNIFWDITQLANVSISVWVKPSFGL